MEPNCNNLNERLLQLTLEIVYLLTGEENIVVSKTLGDGQNSVMVPLHSLLIPERKNEQKILIVTQNIIDLLMGESEKWNNFNIRIKEELKVEQQDSMMKERECLEGHKDLYKDVMMDNQPPLTSPDGHDVWNTSEEHLMFSPDHSAVDNGITQYSPDVNHGTEDLHHILYYEDRSLDPSYSKDSSYKLHTDARSYYPEVHNVDRSAELPNLEFPFYSPNILPRLQLADRTPDSYKPEESSLDNLDGVLLKVEEMFPYSIEDNCLSATSTLAVHQRANAEERPFSCSECGRCFHTKLYLACHKKVHSGIHPYPCLECGKCFLSRSQLNRHVVNHTGVRHYSCPECGKSFLHKSDLGRHLRHHTGERPYVCSECGQYFMQKGHLTRHLKVHTGEKPYLCSECGKCFPRKDSYINHLQIHMDKKMYACKECGKCFALRGMLILHQRVHTRQQPMKSEHGTSLKTTSKFQVHRSVDPVENLCLESDLLRHRGSHSAQEPSEHVIHDSPNEIANTHVKVHTGEKPFSCLECGKSYSQKRHLLTHQRIHTGKLPFACSECGKRFNEKRYLVNHQRNHIGERPFSCSECGKSFTWKESLIRHKKFHSGVRPHCCLKCGKCFTQKGDLLRHQRTHMDKFLFSC